MTDSPARGPGAPEPERPHDALFRDVVGRPANAASVLRSVLPEQISAQLHLDQLRLESSSFVDAEMRWRHTDLLFSTRLKTGDQALVYMLVEHQSSTDPLMAMRLLEYMTRIWRRHLDNNPGTTSLSLVIPVVIHHNRRPWSAPTDLGDLIDTGTGNAADFGEYLPRFRYLLQDLTTVDVERLRSQALTHEARLTLVLLKVAQGSTTMATILQNWRDDLDAITASPGAEELLSVILNYVLATGETPLENLHDLFTDLGPAAKEAYMSTAERLRAEGEARGESRAATRMLVRQLTLKFGPVPEQHLARIHAASPAELDTWADRVLTATTIEDVLQ